VAAALAAAARGVDVVLTEAGDLLGGQLTAQAVPPDEHPWIERFGCTASYRGVRDAIRAYYRAHYPLTEAARARRELNPGGARVSHIAHEPRVAAAVIGALMAPHRAAGRVRVLHRHAPVAAEVDGDRIAAVTFDRGVTIAADWVIDATETGGLLPLCGAERVTGAESREETGEPHAAAVADPLNLQPVSVCFALDHFAGEDHTIPRPDGYERFAGRFSLRAPDPKTLAPVEYAVLPNPGGDPALIGPDHADRRAPDSNLWTFRRIAARGNFVPGAYASDITLVNWPQIDYTDAPVLDVTCAAARTLSRSFLHWLQTEGGLPGLRLRGDLLWDTADGLAPDAYIRESRRIRAEHTIVEQEIALDVRGSRGAVEHRDSVGIGSYRIDLHPSTAGDPYVDIPCCPFQIPLGALIPVRLENLLPGAKNIGTTHIANGSHRLHPVEWNVGEVAGALAAFCAARRVTPRAVRARHLGEFQAELAAAGVELAWPRVSGY
jgi:FAD-dependent oxidoreductase family protein